jgi:SH3 domain-containing YSC84-like protein 1
MAISQRMSLLLVPAVGLLLVGSTASAQMYNSRSYSEETERIEHAREVLRDLATGLDGESPRHFLRSAEAVIVIPSFVSGGFLLGEGYGRGLMSVRDPVERGWSAPVFVNLVGASIAPRIGLPARDLVLLVMDRYVVDDLLRDNIRLGGSVSVAEGPLGPSDEEGGDTTASAEILVYSRPREAFESWALQGVSLRPDDEANARFYGKRLSAEDVVLDQDLRFEDSPAVAREWDHTLRMLSQLREAD